MIIFGLSPHRCCSKVGHAIEDDLVNNHPGISRLSHSDGTKISLKPVTFPRREHVPGARV
jgi:hypothetical protein